MKRLFALLFVAMLGTACYAQRDGYPVSEELLSAFAPRTNTANTNPFLYREALIHPEKADPAALVIFLHGASGRGDDNLLPLGMPAVKNIYNYLENRGIKAYFLVPQCPRTASWSGVATKDRRSIQSGQDNTPYVNHIMPVLQNFIKTRAIDTSRIYILGTSMGAAGVWEIIAGNPDFFASGMAASGGYRGDKIQNLTATPIICTTGTEENTYGQNMKMIEKLKSLGADALFIALGGQTHVEACNNAFTRENLDWVFSKTR